MTAVGGSGPSVPPSLDSVLDQVTDGVLHVDRDFVYTYLNDAGAGLVGRTPESLVGRCMWDEFPQARGTVVEERYRQALSTQQVVEFEAEFAPLAEVFSIRVFPSPDGLTIVYQDVTAAVRERRVRLAAEETFRQQAQHAADVAFRADGDGVIRWCSDGVQAVLGYTPEEVVGRHGSQFVHPDDRERAATLRPDQETGAFPPMRLRLLAKDGSVRWMNATAVLLCDADGTSSVVGGWRDVTAEQSVLEALEVTREEFRLLAENASDVVYRVGADGLATWVSPNVSVALGWEPADLVGTRVFDLVHPEDQVKLAALRQSALAGHDVDAPPGGFVSRYRSKDGRWVWMSVHTTVIRDREGTALGVVNGMRDVSDLVEARDLARQTQARLQATLDTMLDPHVMLRAVRDSGGRIVDFVYVDANPAACAYNGMAREDLIGARLLELQPGHLSSGLLDSYRDVVETGEPLILDDFAYEQELLGSVPRRYDIRGVRVGDAISYTWRDVTERYETAQRLTESEERYRLLAENSSDVVLRSRENTVVWVSPSLTPTLGWTPGEWIGHSLAEFGHPDDHGIVLDAQADLRRGGPVLMRIRFADNHGDWHWVEAHTQVYRNAQGEPDGYLTSFRVVDVEVEAERLLERRATYDDLTGAMKRDPALQQLHDIGQHPRTPGSETGVLFIDVDDFKHVNDSHGHAAGDALLRRYTEAIRECIRAGDTIARMGGDEFLVILTGLHTLDEATAIAEKIRAACAAPVSLREGSVSATVSIGVTLSNPIETGDSMIARADHAMYTAKASGRNQVITVP